MKKALAILLALALVGGAVFAEDVSITGSATLSWGINLDTMATGFKNEASLSLKFPLHPKATVSKGADADVYGYIEFKDLEWNLTSAATPAPGTFAGTATGSVTAKIVFYDFELGVYNKPDLAFNKMADIEDGEVEYANTYEYGTSLKYNGDPLAFTFKMLSDGDWTTNTAGYYAMGADVVFTMDMFKVQTSMAYDLATKDVFNAGVAVPVTLADIMHGLTITPAADFEIGTAFAYDAGAAITLNFSEANADDVKTKLYAKAYYSNADENAEMTVAFDEVLSGGLMDNVEFGVKFLSINFIDAAEFPWALETYAGYKAIINDENNLYARADFDINYLEKATLEAEVVFTNTTIANTTFTLTYKSGDLMAEKIGTIIAAAKIKY